MPDVTINLDDILPHSFRDFHAKGLDYLCLRRGADVTLKVYFFDDECSGAPEIVAPHDHRYDFVTYVVAGQVTNNLFAQVQKPDAPLFDRYEYRTPLNGGDGFSLVGQKRLGLYYRSTYLKGDHYNSRAAQVHTIGVRPRTILRLTQFEDVVPIDKPTSTFVRASLAAPTLDGLYREMDADHAIALLRSYYAALGLDEPRFR